MNESHLEIASTYTNYLNDAHAGKETKVKQTSPIALLHFLQLFKGLVTLLYDVFANFFLLTVIRVET